MKTLFTIIGLAAATLAGAQAQVQINALNTALTQNFNSIGNGTLTWTNNSTIAGWYFNAQANGNLTSSNGTTNTGQGYNFGSTGGADRAIGYVGSGGNSFTNIGVQLINNTGSTITSLTVGYSGELWRSGGLQPTNSNNIFAFAYQTGLIALPSNTSTTGWTTVTSLNYAPTVAVAAGALSGTATPISFSITGLTIANGTGITLRWIGNDGSGTDAGIAIDDFSVIAVPEPTTWALIGLGSAFALWNIRRRRTINA